MNWLWYAILAYAVYSVTNFTDKFLLEKRVKDPMSVTILNGSLYLLLGTLLFFISGAHILSITNTILLIGGGTFLTFYMIPYFKALTLEDTSRVVPLFLFYPVFTLLFSVLFLHESLRFFEIVGFFLILLGGFVIGTEKISLQIFSLRKALFLMVLASFFYTLSNVIFKFVTVNNFWTNFSYLTWGSAVGCIILLLKKENRLVVKEQLHGITWNTICILIINSSLNLLAEFLAFYAISVGPVGLVSAVNGVQPFIVLLYGIILTFLFPKIIKEDIKKETVLIKIIASVMLFIGIYLINI